MNVTLREPMNGFTHLWGIFLAVISFVLLLNRPFPPLTPGHRFTFALFGGAMILLYFISTLYHWLPLTGKSLEVFRKLDHIMIFVFIAASYTPVCVIILTGKWGGGY